MYGISDNVANATTARLSSGSLPLDTYLSGGWCRGALHALYGPVGSGKTTLALKSAAKLTQQRHWAALVTRGNDFFPPAAQALKVDLRYLLWVHPATLERCVWTAEQLVRSGVAPLVILLQIPLQEKAARRLQLAAEKSGVCILMAESASQVAYPVLMKLQVERRAATQLKLSVLHSKIFLPTFSTEVNLDESENLIRLFYKTADAGSAS